jgi:ketosteroid isomerase-like protein
MEMVIDSRRQENETTEGAGGLDAFLSDVLPRQMEAEVALHQGDVEPRLELWSHRDPVTLFGAWGPNKSGWDGVSRTFRWVASRFSNNHDYTFELVAAGVSGDIGYTVGFERETVSVDGGPAQPNMLRVTHVYRRENGEWKIVHRHGDYPPVDQSAPSE